MSVSELPKGLHALVVDDEASVRQALRLAMEFAGWVVVEASSAAEALEHIDEQMPDLIACDKNMPGDSGIDLLRKVRARSDRVSFHLITGFGNAESAEAGMELDIDSYTEKPFKDIFAVIHHIGAAHERRQAKSAQRDERARGARAEGSTDQLQALVVVADGEGRTVAADLLREVFGPRMEVVEEPSDGAADKSWDIVVTDLKQADATLATYSAPLAVVWSSKPIRPHEMIGFADKGATAVVTRSDRETLKASLQKQKTRMHNATVQRDQQGIPSSLPRAPSAREAKPARPAKPPPPAAKVPSPRIPPPRVPPLSASLQPPKGKKRKVPNDPAEAESESAETLDALVVDDEAAIRKALRSAMELRGWNVREAESGDAGLDAVREQMPDLIVCDKNMPGRSGIDLLQDVRWLSEDTSFHLLTAFANEKSAQASMVLGADSYLQKPFEDVFKLLDTIEQAHRIRSDKNDFRRERGQFGPSLRSLPPKQHESALQTAIIIQDDMMRSLAAAAVVEMAPVGTELEQWATLPSGDRVADLVVCDPDVVAEVTRRFRGAEVLVWSDKTVPRELRFALANRGVRAVVASADQDSFRDELGTILARALTPSDTRPAVTAAPEGRATTTSKQPPAKSVPTRAEAVDSSSTDERVPGHPSANDETPELQIDEITQHELHRAMEGIENKNFYEVLGVPTNATKVEIRSAYFVLSKKFHPDAFFGRELGQYKKMMEVVFRTATDAYEVLSRRKRRIQYDKENNIVVEPRTESQPIPPPLSRSMPSPSKVAPTQRNVVTPRDRTGSGGRYRVPSRGPSRSRVVSESSRDAATESELLAQARDQEKRGDVEVAIRTLRRALARHPSMLDLQNELDRLVHKSQSSAESSHRAQAEALTREERWEQAAEAWAAICERAPSDVVAHVQAARAMIEANRNLVDAKRYAETAIRLDDGDLDAKVLLARIYAHAGMRVQAKKQLKAVLQKDGGHEGAAKLLKQLES